MSQKLFYYGSSGYYSIRYLGDPFSRNCSRIVPDSRINFCNYIYRGGRSFRMSKASPKKEEPSLNTLPHLIKLENWLGRFFQVYARFWSLSNKNINYNPHIFRGLITFVHASMRLCVCVCVCVSFHSHLKCSFERLVNDDYIRTIEQLKTFDFQPD